MMSPRRMLSPRQWRQWLAMLVSRDESPWRMALALAIGVFISFTPFWGFQTLMAVLIATVARLNVPLTLAGTWLNLPWFAPFVYAGAVWIGSALLHEVLDRADREHLPAYLEATSPRNRALYERHGFEVTGELRCADCPPLWAMWRAPRARVRMGCTILRASTEAASADTTRPASSRMAARRKDALSLA